jgi:hypothetical protein
MRKVMHSFSNAHTKRKRKAGGKAPRKIDFQQFSTATAFNSLADGISATSPRPDEDDDNPQAGIDAVHDGVSATSPRPAVSSEQEYPAPQSRADAIAGERTPRPDAPATTENQDQEPYAKKKRENVNRVPGAEEGQDINGEDLIPFGECSGFTAEIRSIITNGEWLDDRHMHLASEMIKEQYGGFDGLLRTQRVPFNDRFNEGSFIYSDTFPKAEGDCIQMHNVEGQHWVVSARINDKVYLLDSLGGPSYHGSCAPEIHPKLELQLCAIYGKAGKSLRIHFTEILKQTDFSSCGVHAIANAQYIAAYRRVPNDVRYKHNRMRSHLLECFEGSKFTDFPASKIPAKLVQDVVRVKDLDPTHCFCGLAPMLACDSCTTWIHFPCAGFRNCNYNTVKATLPKRWLCSNCALK